MTATAERTAADPGAAGDPLADALRRAVRGEVAFDDYSRHLFSSDASMYAVLPRGVVYPRDADDVAAVVRVCGEHGVPVTARGGGTSLAGQTTGPGVVLDVSRHMHRILELDPVARTARVQPGVVQDQLNTAAAAHGLMFGPDTSTSNRATIGGMVGNNSAGSGSLRYGMTIDHVRELEVVLADGTRARLEPVDEEERALRTQRPGLEGQLYRELPRILDEARTAVETGYPPFWRRACGYRLDRLLDAERSGGPFDLATFVVGSEGTLALVTEAVVGLVPKPRAGGFAVGHFRSSQAAIAATVDALSCEPAQVELMDRTILDLSRERLEYRALGDLLVDDPDALLFVSFTGDDDAEVMTGIERLEALWAEHGHGYHVLRAVTKEQQTALLKVRKSSLGLLMAASTGTRRPLAFVEDTAVPPEHLAEYTDRFRQVLEQHGMTAGFYGHCSVGCLHIRPFVDVSDPDEVQRMRSVAHAVMQLVREYGGVNSSEHGDGLVRSEFNREVFGDELYAAFQRVKRLFDPAGVLNPGKIVDAPPMTENLRDAQLPPAAPLRTRLDFSVTGGMRGAADRCMNIGLCRKSTSGTMCPSYPVTMMEEHSTRGRANALVKALSQPDPHAALASDERLHEALDLCLMCKACKAECPLGVDLASMKAEVLAAQHDEHGTPLRSRVFGHIRTLNRLGSATAPLSNVPTSVTPVRRLVARAIGVAPQRPLPVFARESLLRWWRRSDRPGSAPRGEVVFLADSFTTFTEPLVGRAAIELLEAAGYRVRLESGGCCGRAAYSKGLLDDARRSAKKLASRIATSTAPGTPVVGCEPSCILTLREEHPQLLPDDPLVRDVAGRVRLPEELLVEAIDAGHLRLRPVPSLAGRRVVFHGHCHQKAEAGTAATMALLRRLPGVAEVVEVDAGCCGMAGSFGFEAEHYDASMAIGEDRLFPALRAAGPDAVLAATGVSCRQQIGHGVGATAVHPVELVRRCLVR